MRVARTEKLIKNSKKIKNFKVGDFVVCQDILDRESKWTKKGKVVRVTNGKNSYVVELETGGEIERHRHHICDDKTHESYGIMGFGNLGNITDVSESVARSMSQENSEMGQTDSAHEIAHEIADDSDEEMINLPQAQGQGSPVQRAAAGQGQSGEREQLERRHTRANPLRPVPSLYPVDF